MGEPTDTSATESADGATAPASTSDAKKRRKRSRWRIFFTFLGVLLVFLIAARLALPSVLRWYVNRVIDQNPLYDGQVGEIDVSLYRGAYTLKDVRLNKVTGNVPVPLFAAGQIDLAIEWDALLHRKLVGRVRIDDPQLNFVDGGNDSETQTGAGGPWLKMLTDLFPFRINRCEVHNGQIHLRAFASKPPIDVYLSQLDAEINNLSNIRDETTPLISTVKAHGMAMDHARFEYDMKLDPFSYRPTFQLAVRLLGLDVTKINDLARAYGGIDFENGRFSLVVELEAREGRMQGYVKPLFRHLQVLSLKKDIVEDNPLEFFWETVVGIGVEVLKNQSRDQVATLVPISGEVDKPGTDILAMVGNVLRNAFIRAFLPSLQGIKPDADLSFGQASLTDPPLEATDGAP